MRAMTLSELQGPLQAQLTGGDRDILGVSTDSRSLQPGDLFVALSGEHYDGHDYVAQVGDAGAAAAVVSHLVEVPLPQLCVADTQQALGRLGGHNRQLFSGTLVAITGTPHASRNVIATGQSGNLNPVFIPFIFIKKVIGPGQYDFNRFKISSGTFPAILLNMFQLPI